MAIFPQYLQNWAKSVAIAILAIPFTLLFIIGVVLIALPLKLYCSFVDYVAHLVDPDIVKMFTGLGAAQGRDFDDMCRKPYTTEVTCLRFCGSLNFPKIRKELERRIILKLDNSKVYPTLHYPELQQYFTIFMGYLFSKKDPKFDINNHITFYNENCRDKTVTREELMKMREFYMTKPFQAKRSPWEFIIIDNYIPDRSELEAWRKHSSKNGRKADHYWVLLVRLHHALADGFSVQHMLSFMADNPFQTTFPNKLTPLKKFLLTVRALTLGPYDMLKFFLTVDGYHALHLPFKEQSGDYFIIESDLFSAKRVKLIKEKFGVGFTAILLSGISGGIRKYLVEYGKKIPTNMSVAIPFATQEHTDKFTNDFSLTSIKYAVHLEDPKDRVEHSSQQLQSLLSTSLIKMSDFCIDIYGSLPLRLFRKLSEKQIYCSTYSTMPGPKDDIMIVDGDLMEVNYTYGTSVDSASFGISSITYNDNFRFVLFIDTNVIGTRRAANDLMNFITEEFDVLENYPLSGSHRSDKKLTEKDKPLPSSEDKLRMRNWKESINYD